MLYLGNAQPIVEVRGSVIYLDLCDAVTACEIEPDSSLNFGFVPRKRNIRTIILA